MIEKTDLIQMAKHVFRRSRGVPDRRLIHPYRDWFVLLLLSTVLLFAGGAWAAVQFVFYNDLTVEVDQSGSPVAQYNEQSVAAADQLFSRRAAEFAAALQQPGQTPREATSSSGATTTESRASTTTAALSPATSSPVRTDVESPENVVNTSPVENATPTRSTTESPSEAESTSEAEEGASLFTR